MKIITADEFIQSYNSVISGLVTDGFIVADGVKYSGKAAEDKIIEQGVRVVQNTFNNKEFAKIGKKYANLYCEDELGFDLLLEISNQVSKLRMISSYIGDVKQVLHEEHEQISRQMYEQINKRSGDLGSGKEISDRLDEISARLENSKGFEDQFKGIDSDEQAQLNVKIVGQYFKQDSSADMYTDVFNNLVNANSRMSLVEEQTDCGQVKWKITDLKLVMRMTNHLLSGGDFKGKANAYNLTAENYRSKKKYLSVQDIACINQMYNSDDKLTLRNSSQVNLMPGWKFNVNFNEPMLEVSGISAEIISGYPWPSITMRRGLAPSIAVEIFEYTVTAWILYGYIPISGGNIIKAFLEFASGNIAFTDLCKVYEGIDWHLLI